MPPKFPDRRWPLRWMGGVTAILILAVAIPGLLLRGGSSVTVESLRSMDRDDLIRMAAEALSSDGLAAENFDRVTVDRSGEDVCVRFEMSVRYIPLDSEAYYGALRCLGRRLTVRSPLRNPPDRASSGKTTFFVPSDESRAAVSFVMKALAQDPEAGIEAGGDLPEGTVMNILDEGGAYAVEVISETLESRLRVDKETGGVTELWHAELVPDPEDGDEDPEEHPTASMTTLRFEPGMLTGLDLTRDVPKFEPPSTLSFSLLGEPTVTDDAISLIGSLVNDSPDDVPVIVFPVGGVNPFHLELVPQPGITRLPPAGPIRTAAPPPPMALVLPPHSTMSLRAVLQLDDYRYEGTPAAQLRWSFQYWLNAVQGEVGVTFPPR